MLAEQTQTDILSLTPSAVDAVRDLLNQRNLDGYALRIYISGGGCSGLQYGMALDDNIRENDFSSDFDDIKVIIDEVSIDYLRGSTVDYVNDVMASGFKIDNPNAMAACGCGSSFRTNDEQTPTGTGGGCNSCY